jgi:hypothetical protein
MKVEGGRMNVASATCKLSRLADDNESKPGPIYEP